MNDLSWVAKLAGDFGVLGALILALVLFYRLADKWAAEFLKIGAAQVDAMAKQASATSSLAGAVKEGQSDQREVLIAVRVLADKMDRQGRYLEQIEQRLDSNCVRCRGKEAA